MHLTHPLTSLAPTLDMGVLAVLARSTRVVGLTHVAEALDTSRTGTRAAAERLAEQGLVDVVTVGRAKGYALNREHVLVPAILSALRAPAEIRARIRALVDEWPLPPAKVILFGSMARGDADAGSDIDLVVLHDDAATPDDDRWAEQLLELSSGVRRWTGNDCDVLAFSSKEWTRMHDTRNPLATEVDREGVLVWESVSAGHDGNAA